MAHHRTTRNSDETQLGTRWLTLGLIRDKICRWLTMGLKRDKICRRLGCRPTPFDTRCHAHVHTWWKNDFQVGFLPVSGPYSRRSTGGSSVLPATLSGSSRLSENITSAGVTSMDPPSHTGSTSIGAPDNMNHYLDPLSHTALPITITISTTTTTYARVPSVGLRTQIETRCDQQTTIKVSSWFTLCISPPPSSAG